MPRKKNYKSKNYRRKNRKGGKNYKKKKYNKISAVTIRQPGVIAADKYRVKLRYIDTTSSTIGSSPNSYGYVRYIGNSLYDPNPLILSTTVPGFKQLTTIYNKYRVRGCKITVNCANMEAFPVMVLIWPSYKDLATSVSNTFLQEMIGNPYCKYKLLAAKGGMDRTILSSYMGWSKFVGTKNVVTDTDYAADVGQNPAIPLYWNIGTYTLTTTAFTSASVQFECRLTFYSEMYERIPLNS